jgi:hypothetical protein
VSTSAAHYDAVIIGAGMSGLAAAVRLGMFGRKVLVLERHNAPGGLNSFYARGKRKYDVGLHALTNWVPEGAKGAPLVKLMRQLRIRREELDLCPQLGSRVTMAGKNLRLNNDYEALLADVDREFPPPSRPTADRPAHSSTRGSAIRCCVTCSSCRRVSTEARSRMTSRSRSSPSCGAPFSAKVSRVLSSASARSSVY